MRQPSVMVAMLATMDMAHAHEGHGMGSAVHWHTTDAVGLLVAAIAVAAVWWLGRGK